MYQRPTDQLAHVNPQITALRVGGNFGSRSDWPMKVFQSFVVGRQETRSGHRQPPCVSWTERIVMIGGAEIILALGQEICFHLVAPGFTPRRFYHHVSVVTIQVVSLKGRGPNKLRRRRTPHRDAGRFARGDDLQFCNGLNVGERLYVYVLMVKQHTNVLISLLCLRLCSRAFARPSGWTRCGDMGLWLLSLTGRIPHEENP